MLVEPMVRQVERGSRNSSMWRRMSGLFGRSICCWVMCCSSLLAWAAHHPASLFPQNRYRFLLSYAGEGEPTKMDKSELMLEINELIPQGTQHKIIHRLMLVQRRHPHDRPITFRRRRRIINGNQRTQRSTRDRQHDDDGGFQSRSWRTPRWSTMEKSSVVICQCVYVVTQHSSQAMWTYYYIPFIVTWRDINMIWQKWQNQQHGFSE